MIISCGFTIFTPHIFPKKSTKKTKNNQHQLLSRPNKPKRHTVACRPHGDRQVLRDCLDWRCAFGLVLWYGQWAEAEADVSEADLERSGETWVDVVFWATTGELLDDHWGLSNVV